VSWGVYEIDGQFGGDHAGIDRGADVRRDFNVCDDFPVGVNGGADVRRDHVISIARSIPIRCK
jgi:hypothetical protein